MFYTYEENLNASKNAETEEGRTIAAKAFGIQAADSGQVADAVIGRYNDIISGKAENVQEGELEKLQETMKSGLERANQNLEAMKTIQETTNRVADALYNIR
jgi:coenzyme F420-reducing hydrogenase alpha subunit